MPSFAQTINNFSTWAEPDSRKSRGEILKHMKKAGRKCEGGRLKAFYPSCHVVWFSILIVFSTSLHETHSESICLNPGKSQRWFCDEVVEDDTQCDI